jgi:hypothetical protein
MNKPPGSLHPGQSARDQVAQERQPAGAVLARDDVHYGEKVYLDSEWVADVDDSLFIGADDGMDAVTEAEFGWHVADVSLLPRR